MNIFKRVEFVEIQENIATDPLCAGLVGEFMRDLFKIHDLIFDIDMFIQ